MERILVAVDGSECAQKAARLAADIALRFGAKLTLVYVVPQLLLPPDAYGVTLVEAEREHAAFAEKLLGEAALKLGEPGVPMDTQVLYGPPAETIAELARSPDVSLVAVGSRGRGAVARMFLGSVSHRLVHICPKPVLVMHEEKGSVPSPHDP